MGYTVFVTAAVLIMILACIAVLYMESRISLQQANINELETQLEVIEEENAAYRLSLENMYTLDEIYYVATNELGMVYAEKGQIVYYESADEDYVKQYQDVPEAN
jgi:cell division protein FtsL